MPRRPKIEKRQRALELIRQGYSDAAAARAVSVSHTAVSKWRREAGIPARRSNQKTDAPRSPSQRRRQAPQTVPGMLVHAARELLPGLVEQPRPSPAPRARREPAPLPSAEAVARAAAKARTVAQPGAAGAPVAEPVGLASAAAAGRAGLAELERTLPASGGRSPVRRGAPRQAWTSRLVLAGCGHTVELRSGDKAGQTVRCGVCTGAPSRVVRLVLRPGDRFAY